MFAALDWFDLLIVAGIFMAFTGGGAAVVRRLPTADRERLRRLEGKIDLIMIHLGLEYTPPAPSTWQQLADDPAGKIAAINAYREEHGVDLAEAKRAVEAYQHGITRADGSQNL